jgi:hypothetical protein
VVIGRKVCPNCLTTTDGMSNSAKRQFKNPFGRLLGVYVSEWCVALFPLKKAAGMVPAAFFMRETNT